VSVPDGEDIVQDTFLALFHHLQRDAVTIIYVAGFYASPTTSLSSEE
jgi:hypothetical protein